MNWADIILAVLGLGFVGDVVLRLFKSNRRIENAKADSAEIEVEKNKAIAQAEAKKALEEAHDAECKLYEERIKDLHNSIDKLNEQLDYYIGRDKAKEERFDNQTEKLRDVQRKLLDATQEITEYVKKIGALELELAKYRCNVLDCPFRQPPTADTPSKKGLTKDKYFKVKENGN